jgi:hypothetical protein
MGIRTANYGPHLAVPNFLWKREGRQRGIFCHGGVQKKTQFAQIVFRKPVVVYGFCIPYEYLTYVGKGITFYYS